ncbi:MAG: hypothetical protein R2762_16635 [Bryobacteraceae bacterium]
MSVTFGPQPASVWVMPEWLTMILLLAGYVVVMRWVLPRLGVPT